ncbi:hypothetical protein [Amycolatopsis albispora]|uniref:hypothetical protein n=1 Tax=Amycolatopsis albispora TaxID=1804986 RepID=UPI0013B3FACF|nr:hypothetical protein [Amycolatopsis albispora]
MARDLTRLSGENEAVTVYGSKPWTDWPWLLGGGGALLLAVLVLVARRKLPSD